MKYTCPCCGFKTLDRAEHYWDICPVCFWESCPIGNIDVDRITGPNKTTLRVAQHNFIRFGACEPEMIKHVRPPLPNEIKDAAFRLLDERGK